ncbi:unnamed protein product [Calicophoron daubneyi]|uniref:Uncharacterized protein n=1 Tax=Calicophoron daubneyi TaxID=300641 RepID=A0AAV2TNV3_CALDB
MNPNRQRLFFVPCPVRIPMRSLCVCAYVPVTDLTPLSHMHNTTHQLQPSFVEIVPVCNFSWNLACRVQADDNHTTLVLLLPLLFYLVLSLSLNLSTLTPPKKEQQQQNPISFS